MKLKKIKVQEFEYLIKPESKVIGVIVFGKKDYEIILRKPIT